MTPSSTPVTVPPPPSATSATLIPTSNPDSSLSFPCPSLSSRPERPDSFLLAVFWRVGPRSGGICISLRPEAPGTEFVPGSWVPPVAQSLRTVLLGSSSPGNLPSPPATPSTQSRHSERSLRSEESLCLLGSSFLCKPLRPPRRRLPRPSRGVIFSLCFFTSLLIYFFYP